jgi:two-component system, NtrC family, sensor kinase
MTTASTTPAGGPPEKPQRRAVVPPLHARALARLSRDIAPTSLLALGLEIPLLHRLSAKIFALIGIVALATLTAFMFAEWAVQHHLVSQGIAESDLLSHTIRNALHRAMLQDRRTDAYLIMHDIGRQEGIEKVRMMDQDGRITFSTERHEIGKNVDRKAESCSACHAEGEPLHRIDLSDRSRVFQVSGHRVLGIVTPLYNEESCAAAACHAHPAERKVLGVLDVSVSLARVDERTASLRLWTLAAAAVVAALLGYVVWLFLRRHVIQPVAALVQATRRVARDQLELEVPVTWKGELGILAASFNDMTRSLRVTKAQLDDLMHGLERQVEERTAALRGAQDQLVRSEKLASLGKLSASIAHEINNPLAGILTFAKLCVRTLEEGPSDDATRKQLVGHLLLVQRETGRCSAIVRNLLDFARDRPLSKKEIDANAVIDEALQLLGNQIQIQGVELERRLGAVPPVEGDFGQLRQACVNVIMNACEAMARGGRLVVQSGVLADGTVELAFQDSGPGIPPDHLHKIFDPFFTTKEKGTGLGLSVVYGIVEKHGGSIDLTSEVGKGTRIGIRLRPARKAADAAAVPPGSGPAGEAGTRTDGAAEAAAKRGAAPGRAEGRPDEADPAPQGAPNAERGFAAGTDLERAGDRGAQPHRGPRKEVR